MKTIEQMMQDSGVGFGTSGARGLVTQMSDQVCYSYTLGFIQYLRQSKQCAKTQAVALAGDLRPSTQRIMNACAKAIQDSGLEVINCGTIASPAVALFGLHRKVASIMVTGSHIPDDRNGIKFNTPFGEILKTDEVLIKQQQIVDTDLFDQQGQFMLAKNFLPPVSSVAANEYHQRFIEFFPKNGLMGLKVGIYQHSGVARDLLQQLINELGAKTICLNRSEKFIPVDTEAIRAEDVLLAQQWVKEYQLDAIVSTDGDADRPLIADEKGQWFRGDIVGLLCANYLGIKHIVTPVSSNSVVERMDVFCSVTRTQIGSPFVITKMQELLAKGEEKIAGYEANGGFLMADDICINNKCLTALPTRDAIIVILSVLFAAKNKQVFLSQLTQQLPQRFTFSDRLKEIPVEYSQQVIQKYIQDCSHQQFLTDFASVFADKNITVKKIDQTDGLRVFLSNDEIIHFRPSGNAPEFRCYTEADSLERATSLNQQCLAIIKPDGALF